MACPCEFQLRGAQDLQDTNMGMLYLSSVYAVSIPHAALQLAENTKGQMRNKKCAASILHPSSMTDDRAGSCCC